MGVIDPTRAADPTKAIAAYLQARVGSLLVQTPSGLQGIAAGVPAVFRPDMPLTFDQAMPAACIIVRPAGGYTMYGKGQLPVGDPRIDMVCYGAVRLQADQIARACVVALKQLSEQIWEDTLLYWAQISAGPLPLPDQQTLWPASLVSAQVMHGEALTA
jgi:hypothetical protein